MSERAAPFYCPYCGDEDLSPYEGHGTWACGGCVRVFKVSFVGIAAPAGRAMVHMTGNATDDVTGEQTERTETQ